MLIGVAALALAITPDHSGGAPGKMSGRIEFIY